MLKRYIVPLFILTMFLAGSVAVLGAETTSSRRSAKKIFDPVCATAFVDAREDKLLAGFETKYNALRAARETRAASLHTAWLKTGIKERNAAIKTAWDTYHRQVRSAKAAWKKSHKDAWNTFSSRVKTCGLVTSTDVSNAQRDSED